jgi:hypothetical protein
MRAKKAKALRKIIPQRQRHYTKLPNGQIVSDNNRRAYRHVKRKIGNPK